MNVLDLKAPSGEIWVFLVLFAVVVGGPLVVERLRAPGIVGLFVGGFIVGPHGLGLIGSGNTTVPALGKLGLLYLMFVAGLELDLRLVRTHRRSVVVFSILSFSAPMLGGTAAGLLLGFGTAAALLLGALLASHTLIVYPTIRRFGLGSDPAVATGVGATVVTDTLALILLAGVIGSTRGGASGSEVGVQITLGLLIVGAFSFVVLPRAVEVFLARFGASRTNRYLCALVALLAAATVAEVVQIEGIIGAFFAGLALNRLVPNEGDLMHRIDFFGSAVFIPVFMVSVGMVLDPSVMVEPETLGMVGIFALACLGGKALAVALTRPLLGFSWAQVGVLFSLTAAQAAATLAVADVGLKNGLFGTSVFNAVLGLILVSLVVSSAVAAFAGRRVPRPEATTLASYGRRVLLVALAGSELRPPVVALAVRLAGSDAGVVVPTIIAPDDAAMPDRHELERLEQPLARAGADLPLVVHAGGSLPEGVAHAASSASASAVVVDDAEGHWLAALGLECVKLSVPLLLVGAAGGRVRRVVALSSATPGGVPVDEVARRLAPRRGLGLSGRERAEVLTVEEGDAERAALTRTDMVVMSVSGGVRSDVPAGTLVTVL